MRLARIRIEKQRGFRKGAAARTGSVAPGPAFTQLRREVERDACQPG